MVPPVPGTRGPKESRLLLCLVLMPVHLLQRLLPHRSWAQAPSPPTRRPHRTPKGRAGAEGAGRGGGRLTPARPAAPGSEEGLPGHTPLATELSRAPRLL